MVPLLIRQKDVQRRQAYDPNWRTTFLHRYEIFLVDAAELSRYLCGASAVAAGCG